MPKPSSTGKSKPFLKPRKVHFHILCTQPFPRAAVHLPAFPGAQLLLREEVLASLIPDGISCQVHTAHLTHSVLDLLRCRTQGRPLGMLRSRERSKLTLLRQLPVHRRWILVREILPSMVKCQNLSVHFYADRGAVTSPEVNLSKLSHSLPLIVKGINLINHLLKVLV